MARTPNHMHRAAAPATAGKLGQGLVLPAVAGLPARLAGYSPAGAPCNSHLGTIANAIANRQIDARLGVRRLRPVVADTMPRGYTFGSVHSATGLTIDTYSPAQRHGVRAR